jgi:hypothetical protein
MALAEFELVPVWYSVEDASSTVTFWPAAVDRVKLDADTLSTVPVAPPAAGPDRALDPAGLDPVVAGAVDAVPAVVELLLEVVLPPPQATPPTAKAVTATAMAVVRFQENMRGP